MQNANYSGDLKSRLFEGWISNGSIFKWSSFRYGWSYSPNPNHLKTRPFKILISNVWKVSWWASTKWSLTKWQPFIRISNCRASGFQIPFKIRNSCNPTSFWPFKIRLVPISDLHFLIKTKSKLLFSRLHQGGVCWTSKVETEDVNGVLLGFSS